jgi:hypothetical protein
MSVDSERIAIEVALDAFHRRPEDPLVTCLTRCDSE